MYRQIFFNFIYVNGKKSNKKAGQKTDFLSSYMNKH